MVDCLFSDCYGFSFVVLVEACTSFHLLRMVESAPQPVHFRLVGFAWFEAGIGTSPHDPRITNAFGCWDTIG